MLSNPNLKATTQFNLVRFMIKEDIKTALTQFFGR